MRLSLTSKDHPKRPLPVPVRRALPALAVTILCLAGIEGLPWSDPEAPALRVVVVDLSRSHGPRREKLAGAAWTRLMVLANAAAAADDRFAIVGFGTGSVVLLPPTPVAGLVAARSPAEEKVRGLPPTFGDGSDLSAGLSSALALAGEGRVPRLTILGDGRYSDWDLATARRLVREQRGSLDFVVGAAAGAGPPDPDLRLSLDGPMPEFTRGAPGVLRLRVDGVGVGQRHVRLRIGDLTRTVSLDARLGPTIVQVRIVPEERQRAWIEDAGGPDADPANDGVVLPIASSEERRAAVFGRRSEEVAQGLEAAGWSVPAKGGIDGPAPEVLTRVQVLVLADCPVDEGLDPARVSRIEQAVREQGLGLVVLGGPRAFRAGGYAGSRLDDLLPLSSRPPRGRDVRVVLDRSGSMEAGDRLGRAVEATLRLARGLAPEDRLQVVPFAAAPEAPLPPSPQAPAAFLADATALLWALVPSGGTALRLALEQLEWSRGGRPEAERERVAIVISDFRDPALDAAEVQAALRDAWAKAQVRGIAIVLDPEAEAEARAKALGCQVHPVRALAPELLLQAVERRGWIEEVRRAGWTDAALDPGPSGEIRGFNPVLLGKEARLLLQSDAGDALAAVARRGAGEVAAAAVDPVLEPWTRHLPAALASRVAAPADGVWRATVDEGRLVVFGRGAGGVAAGRLQVRAGGRRWRLQEVEPDRWEGAGPWWPGDSASAGEPLVIEDEAGRPVSRLTPPWPGDPEFQAQAPAALPGVALPADGTTARRVRWPIEVGLLLVLALWAFLVSGKA